MKLVESMSKKTAKLTADDFVVESRSGDGNPTFSAFDGKWKVKIRETNWGWRISAEDDRNNVRQQPIGSQYDTMQEAIDAWNQKKIASRTAREGDGDCVTDFALPYDYDETEHQRDELKHLGEGGWDADGGPDEKETTWRKHDGGYQATVVWDDGGEKRYRWDVLDTDDRTVESGHSDSIEDAKSDADDALKSYIEDEKKAARDFKVAQEIEELTDAADQFFDDEDGVPAGQIAKAEWVASRMAERRLAKRVGDGVLNHLASMGSTTGLLACARLSDRKAFDEYKAEFEHRAKHASRKPLLKTKEARFKAWASRKIAFNGDCEVFIGAVSNPTNGDWLKLPASDSEIDEAIERAQTGPDGEYYEEVMISDTSGLGSSVGEYDDIRSVNEWVEAIEDAGLDDDLIEAMLDEYDLEYVADNIENVDYWPDVSDEEDLGYRIVDELGFDGISDDEKKMYFDYEGFGRDIVINDGYTIDNGFAYRVASRTAIACDMHDRMLVSFAEKNLKEKVEGKVKTKVKTCGKMAGRRNQKRKASAMTSSVKFATLYDELTSVPDSDIDHWNSDLYLRKTPETEAIIDGYEFKGQVTTFVDEIDGDVWYEIPFAYDPAWSGDRG